MSPAARRLVALALGAALLLTVFFSPAVTLMVGVAPGAKPVSVRSLNYLTSMDRLRDPSAYAIASAGLPVGNRNLLVYGSSELSSRARQNPATFFPERVADFDLFVSGRGYTQSLQQAIMLAGTASSVANKKVALILSPQWFTGGGTSREAFQTVFSSPGYYAMDSNPALKPETKRKIAARSLALGAPVPTLDVGARKLPQALASAVAARFDSRMVELRSVRDAAGRSAPYAVAPGAVPISQLDWAAELRTAEAEGKAAVHNAFNIEDGYFAHYIADQIDKLKDSFASVDYSLDSPEYGDLELFLDVAADNGIEVLLVSVPMNGKWYDYLGYPAERRAKYYDRIRSIAQHRGAQLADFSGEEYTPYFLYDTMHLGWKGWLDVSRACVDFARA